MRANLWNAVLFAGKRECCVLSILVMMFTGIIFTTPTKAQWAPTAPVDPSDLAVASDGGNALMLIWDDNSDNEDNFIVERKIGTKGTFSTFATLPAETSKWRDDNTANLYNTPYIYRIKAVNTIGESQSTLEAGAVTELAPPTQCQIITSRDLERPPANPAPPLPLRFQKFRDDMTALRIIRLTSEQDGSTNSTAYSYWTTFNSNNTRIFIINGSGGGYFYRMDPVRFRIIGDKTPIANNDLETQGLTWSKTDPDIAYATTRSTSQLRKYDVSTGNTSIVKTTGDFTATELRGGELKQMTVSEENDDVFSWELQNACPTNAPCSQPSVKGSYFFTYKHSATPAEQVKRGLFIQNRLVITDPPADPPRYENDYNEMHVSKNGDYLLRALNNPERRDFFATGNSNPTAIPFQYVSHFDLGQTFLVGDNSDSHPPKFFRINFADILTTPPTPQPAPTILFEYKDWRQNGGHISLLANDENNLESWALVSNFTKKPDPGHLEDIENMKREIFMIKTDSTQPVLKRLAHHYSVAYSDGKICTSEPDGSPYCYYAEPRANISRDGKFVAFTSTWGVFNGRKDVFILKTECPQVTTSTVALGGRVTRANGMAMFPARVTLVDSAGNTRIRQTLPTGHYNFAGVPVGATEITVSAKFFIFSQPTQNHNAVDDLDDINFTSMQ